MHAEIVAIGDELTSGQRLDTNSQWLSQRLGELGVRVLYHATVGDELNACVDVVRAAINRADIVVATGGLGPTADDLTREAIAAAIGQELELIPEALAHIEQLFARRGRNMPEKNRVQAMFPTGARIVPNPHGTAPGIALAIPREGKADCLLYALPGVPAEMKEMWHGSVAPELAAAGSGEEKRVIRHRRIKCFGTGESHLEQMLPDLIRRGREPVVGITVHEATITLRITAIAESEEACRQQIEPTEATIRQCLGNVVFGEEDDELEHAVLRLLSQRGQTVVSVEGGTAGLLADWLGDVPEAAQFYRGGIVATGEQALCDILDLDLEKFDRQLISFQAAEAMAVACRKRFGADYALAITPFPPHDSQAEQPPQLYIAVADAAGVHVRAANFAGHPAILKSLSAKRALDALRLRLLESAAP